MIVMMIIMVAGDDDAASTAATYEDNIISETFTINWTLVMWADNFKTLGILYIEGGDIFQLQVFIVTFPTVVPSSVYLARYNLITCK